MSPLLLLSALCRREYHCLHTGSAGQVSPYGGRRLRRGQEFQSSRCDSPQPLLPGSSPDPPGPQEVATGRIGRFRKTANNSLSTMKAYLKRNHKSARIRPCMSHSRLGGASTVQVLRRGWCRFRDVLGKEQSLNLNITESITNNLPGRECTMC